MASLQIAQRHGILLDPIWTLSSWEVCEQLAKHEHSSRTVIMLHTGGALGLQGLAQRYPGQF